MSGPDAPPGRASVPGASVVGVGTDLVDVEAFAGSLLRRPRLAVRLFTPDELAYANTGRNRARAQRLAVRFAAKEATMKALGVGLGAFRFHDVAVARDDGRPTLVVRGRAAELAAARDVGRWLVSLSHTRRSAQATVLAIT